MTVGLINYPSINICGWTDRVGEDIRRCIEIIHRAAQLRFELDVAKFAEDEEWIAEVKQRIKELGP